MRILIYLVFVLLALGSAFAQTFAETSCKIVDGKVDCPKPPGSSGPAPVEKGDVEAVLDNPEVLNDADVRKVLKQKGYVE